MIYGKGRTRGQPAGGVSTIEGDLPLCHRTRGDGSSYALLPALGSQHLRCAPRAVDGSGMGASVEQELEALHLRDYIHKRGLR